MIRELPAPILAKTLDPWVTVRGAGQKDHSSGKENDKLKGLGSQSHAQAGEIGRAEVRERLLIRPIVSYFVLHPVQFLLII